MVVLAVKFMSVVFIGNKEVFSSMVQESLFLSLPWIYLMVYGPPQRISIKKWHLSKKTAEQKNPENAHHMKWVIN